MKLLPLQQVSAQLRAGMPLPWGVRDAEGKLLLARGHMVDDDAMVAALLERGMFVDAEEAHAGARSEPVAKKAENYFGRWQSLHHKLGVLLRHPQDPDFLARIRECVPAIRALAERNADLLIFLILRHDYSHHSVYGVAHSLHVAAITSLLAQRLGWPDGEHDSVVGAALTMNLSMIDLQGRLSAQSDPLNTAQRDAVHKHPQASAALLRAAGLDDALWLRTVEQHHERPAGQGYPLALAEPDAASQLVRCVDVFTAMHSARAGRGALPAQQIARELYTQNSGNPVVALLIKEFGIYPPGCYVKLASGETAVVVRRGDSAAKPQAAAVLNRHGDPLAIPMRRDTACPDYAITETVPEKSVRVRVPAEAFFANELVS